MNKKVITVLAAVIVIVLSLFAFTACNNNDDLGKELISNGSFANFDSKTGQFDDWAPSTTTSSSFKFGQDWPSNTSDEEEAAAARLYLDNSSKIYSNLQQTVHVDVNKIYKVSVDIRVTGTSTLTGDYGAYVAFLENTEYKFVYTKQPTDDLVNYTFYVRPRNTDYLTIALCLGTQEEGVSGHVLFDNVSMQRVEKGDVPAGYTIFNFRKARTLGNSTTVDGILFVVFLTLFTACLLIGVYVLLRRLYASKDVFVNFGDKSNSRTITPTKAFSTQDGKWYHNGLFIACAIALGAFLIRLIMLLTMQGMGNSMTSTIETARTLGKLNGVTGYMADHSGSTLAPGAMYILAIIGAMSGDLPSASVSVLIRFVNVLADMAVVLMIYFYGRNRVGNRLSTIYASLYAALPFVFVLSGISGSFESVLVALMLATVLLMVHKQYLATYFMATLSAVFDLRALAIAPIIVAYFVYMYIKDNDDLKKFTGRRAQIVFGLVGSFVLAYLITLPVGINQIAAGDAFYNFKVIVGEMTNNSTFVYNAFNLYSMVAMNGKTVTRGVSILNFIFLLVLEAYAISLYFKNRNRQELILLISFVLAVISVFTVKVDYTYLFLSIAFMLIYTMISGEKRMYLVTSGYALLGFLDIGQLLNQSGFIAANPTGNIVNYETTNAFFITFSVFAVLLTGYFVYVVYSITNNSKLVDIKQMPEPFGKTLKNYFNYLKQRVKSRG